MELRLDFQLQLGFCLNLSEKFQLKCDANKKEKQTMRVQENYFIRPAVGNFKNKSRFLPKGRRVLSNCEILD